VSEQERNSRSGFRLEPAPTSQPGKSLENPDQSRRLSWDLISSHGSCYERHPRPIRGRPHLSSYKVAWRVKLSRAATVSPSSPSFPTLSTLPRFLSHTPPFRSSASVHKPRPTPAHPSLLPQPAQVVPHCRESVVMMNYPNMIHGRRRLPAQRSSVEDHHFHSLPIPRHLLQSQHLNEHDLISTLMPPMPPPPLNHPPPTLLNPSLPSQPKSRRTSQSLS